MPEDRPQSADDAGRADTGRAPDAGDSVAPVITTRVGLGTLSPRGAE